MTNHFTISKNPKIAIIQIKDRVLDRLLHLTPENGEPIGSDEERHFLSEIFTFIEMEYKGATIDHNTIVFTESDENGDNVIKYETDFAVANAEISFGSGDTTVINVKEN